MRLSTIIKQTAARTIGCSIEVDEYMPTVCITDDSNDDDDTNTIFMQGDDAERFIAECDALEKKTRSKTITREQIERCVAAPYIECIFN